MNNRLSFFVPTQSPLHALNPLTKLALVFAMIALAFFSFSWLAPTLVIPIFIAGLVGKVQKQYFFVLTRLILPTVAFMFIMQSLFLPLGDVTIFALWIFDVTRESLQAAFITVSRIFVMVSSFTLLLLTTHPSELMTDLTRRGLPPQFAYVIISTLQIIPQMQAKAQTIIASQSSRGLDTQSTFAKRVSALVPLVGPMVFGSLVEVEERAIAIEARGFTSAHKKTSLHEIPDTRLDQILRWGLILILVLAFASRLWLS